MQTTRDRHSRVDSSQQPALVSAGGACILPACVFVEQPGLLQHSSCRLLHLKRQEARGKRQKSEAGGGWAGLLGEGPAATPSHLLGILNIQHEVVHVFLRLVKLQLPGHHSHQQGRAADALWAKSGVTPLSPDPAPWPQKPGKATSGAQREQCILFLRGAWWWRLRVKPPPLLCKYEALSLTSVACVPPCLILSSNLAPPSPRCATSTARCGQEQVPPSDRVTPI